MRLTFLNRSFLLVGCLGTFLCFANTCRADLPKDESVRKFIHDVADKNKADACKDLGIEPDNAGAVSQVRVGIQILGGKKVDDITRTNFEHNWTNGTATLNDTYHVRSGNEGVYLYLSVESAPKKPLAFDIQFEKGEANPSEVKIINFLVKYWVWLVLGSFLIIGLGIYCLVWFIRRQNDKSSKPPRIPVSP